MRYERGGVDQPSASRTRARSSAPTHPLLRLQQAAGNQAVSTLLQRQEGAAVLPPAPTAADIRARHGAVAALAQQAAKGIWGLSHAKKPVEYGGVVYRDGKDLQTTVRTSGDPLAVDVGQREPNAGCPEGTLPVGYWHTHPHDVDPLTKGPRERRKGAAAFSKDDLEVATQNALDPFVLDKFGFHEAPVSGWFDASFPPRWCAVPKGE